jgi:hypothetical protein
MSIFCTKKISLIILNGIESRASQKTSDKKEYAKVYPQWK